MDSQQQQYCLKWNSFGSNLATSFANLWNSESLADVTLYCEGRQFKAHKVILAACSKHFQELFDTVPPGNAGACYVILEATSADNMQALLEFMYKGEVHVSQDALSSFLKSGENLQVKGLSMEMSQDAWVKQQTQPSSDRHQTRVKTSPVSGAAEPQEGSQTHTQATFAPILPQYALPHHGATAMGRYAPPAHVPLHPTAHRRPAPPKPSPSPNAHTRNYRQSSSSSHCGSVVDEHDTRSSPGAGGRYPEENPSDRNTPIGNPIKNNGYERSASATDEMMERLSNEQGAEDLRIKIENDYHASGGYNTSPPPIAPMQAPNYHDKPPASSPTPPKPSPDIWPANKIITSKSGGIATPDGNNLGPDIWPVKILASKWGITTADGAKPSPDIWPAKMITSKVGGIVTADGKKLKCPYCERLYGYETNLRAHIRQRHQGIRVPCPHCTRTFTRNNTVRRHIAREHRHQVTPHLAPGPLPNHTQ